MITYLVLVKFGGSVSHILQNILKTNKNKISGAVG